MADDNASAQQPPEPPPDLKSLDILVGSREISGGAQGRVTFEWMEGGLFLIQHVDLEQYGQRIKGLEIIGHERQCGAEPSEDILLHLHTPTTAALWVNEHREAA